MAIKFFTITPDIKTNGEALAEGVKGVSCLEARRPTLGEIIDYTPFIPWGCFLSSVEVYANGARNFYVRKTDGEQVKVGYLILRPLTDDEIDAMADRMTGGNDLD
jgi:hypothetical protein